MSSTTSTLFALIGVVLLPGAGVTDEKKPPTTDEQKILGTWRVVSDIVDGKEALNETTAKDRWEITNEQGKKSEKGQPWKVIKSGGEFAMGYVLDPSAKPKTIDMVRVVGAEIRGIYSLEGDELRICYKEKSEVRPTELASKPGSGLTLVILKREKR
jgi:uncharacterized protein (TIGR03067 family)